VLPDWASLLGALAIAGITASLLIALGGRKTGQP
jgi:hypothetical protein